MKLTVLKLAPLAVVATLLAGPVFAADVAPVTKSVKAVAQERNAESSAPKQKPAASTEPARKDVKAEAPGKTRQLEVPVSVVLAAD